MKEVDLAAQVVAYLQDLHWEVYQEVQAPHVDGVADIVAVQRKRVWVVECKTSLSLQVIAQARRWHRFANWTSVAVPYSGRTRCVREFSREVCASFGIGLLEVRSPGYSDRVHIEAHATLNRRAHSDFIRNALHEKMKTWAKAGNAEGRRWTPFTNTCHELLCYVREHEGCELKVALGQIPHHYRNISYARQNMIQWIEAGKVRGVEAKRDGKRITLHLKEEQLDGIRKVGA